MEEGLIKLQDLVKKEDYEYLDRFYIELNPKIKKELYKTLLEQTKTIRKLSEETNIKFTRLWDQLTRRPFSLEILNKLCNFLEKNGLNKYSFKNIEKHIVYIKGGFTSDKIINTKFPINLKTKEGMRFVAHLYHDGGIGAINRQPGYTNRSLKEIKEFLNDAQKLFGKFDRKIVKQISKLSKRGYFTVHLPTVIGDILISAGYNAGDKTKNNPKVFEFIKKLEDPSLIKEFLSKAFNDDGYVGTRSIGIAQTALITNIEKPSNVLILDKILLERLKIRTNGPKLWKKYKNRHGICCLHKVEIYSKRDIGKFHSNIKLIKHKQRKIEDYLTNWGLRNRNESKHI